MASDPETTRVWRIVSYLSADAPEQTRLLGESKEWFCRERQSNRGANYLLGVMVAFIERRVLLDPSQGQRPELSELIELASRMTNTRSPEIWSVHALETSAEWEAVRCYARSVLAIAGMPTKLPRIPFPLESMVELSGYNANSRG